MSDLNVIQSMCFLVESVVFRNIIIFDIIIILFPRRQTEFVYNEYNCV